MNYEHVKAGDRLNIIRNAESCIRTVERVTKTQIVCLDEKGNKSKAHFALKFRKIDGIQVGDWIVNSQILSVIIDDNQEVVDPVEHSVKLNLIAKIRKLSKYDAVAYDHLISLSPLRLKAMIEEAEHEAEATRSSRSIVIERDNARPDGIVSNVIVFRAMFDVQGPDISGCPLGRGESQSAAIYDLIRRTNMESKLSLSYDDLIITRTRDFFEAVEAEPKDADPILDEEELLLETIKDLDFQITQATKKLQDHHKDKAHYLNRLKVYRQGKTRKDPEQEEAERALIKRFADCITGKRITATTLARFMFINKAQDSIEGVVIMVVPYVIEKEDGSLHEDICDLIRSYPEAEISINVWNL